MDYVNLAVCISLLGTIAIVFIYMYLYLLYRERYMGIWVICWATLLVRYAVFDSGLVSWKNSMLGFTAYQILMFISILLLVWGTHIFINKPLNKWWIYSIIILFIGCTVVSVSSSVLVYKLLFPIYSGCLVGIWMGLIFIRQVKLPGYGRLITGYAYILWSVLSFSMPFTINIPWIVPWGYLLGGSLRLVIAVGNLMVYIEKTRNDLANKEAQYRLLAENAVDVIYYYQLLPEPRFDYISPSVLDATGYHAEEYYKDIKLVRRSVHPEDHPLLDQFVKNLPQAAEMPLTLRLVRKDKTILWVEQKCVPIYDENNNLVALEGIIRDITARKNLEKMASAFDRMNMVGSMAATVAHEIRNPMTTVRGYLQVLGRKKEYQADRDKFKLMIEELDRANAIIREYLSLSREKVVNLKKCSLNSIIEALFPLIQADANSAKVYASLELTEIPEVQLDENEIRQLLLNIVRNGIEAMQAGGSLRIRTFCEADNIVLSITDQGSGISQKVLDSLGTPFTTTKENGTGLGLPICYQIAHRHNANIKVDTGPGGTTFFIYFRH